MAKNTGRGTRLGALAGREHPDEQVREALGGKRDLTSGRFDEVKRSGGLFKGVRKES